MVEPSAALCNQDCVAASCSAPVESFTFARPHWRHACSQRFVLKQTFEIYNYICTYIICKYRIHPYHIVYVCSFIITFYDLFWMLLCLWVCFMMLRIFHFEFDDFKWFGLPEAKANRDSSWRISGPTAAPYAHKLESILSNSRRVRTWVHLLTSLSYQLVVTIWIQDDLALWAAFSNMFITIKTEIKSLQVALQETSWNSVSSVLQCWGKTFILQKVSPSW